MKQFIYYYYMYIQYQIRAELYSTAFNFLTSIPSPHCWACQHLSHLLLHRSARVIRLRLTANSGGRLPGVAVMANGLLLLFHAGYSAARLIRSKSLSVVTASPAMLCCCSSFSGCCLKSPREVLKSCEVRSGDRTAGVLLDTGEMASCATARAPNVDSSMSDAIF